MEHIYHLSIYSFLCKELHFFFKFQNINPKEVVSCRVPLNMHPSISPRTNLLVQTAKYSLMEHTKTSYSINIKINNFIILDKMSSSEFTGSLRILENLFIYKEKLMLISHGSSVPLYVTSWCFIIIYLGLVVLCNNTKLIESQFIGSPTCKCQFGSADIYDHRQ